MDEVIPTGYPALDEALGIGGVPKGRIVEIAGDGYALAVGIIAQAQRLGGVAAYVDVHQTLDLRDCRDRGVDCSRMLLSQPDSTAQALDVVAALLRSQQCAIVVLSGWWEGVVKSPTMRKWADLGQSTGTALVVLRDPATLPGVLAFYASVRLDVSPVGVLRVVKNKYAPPRLSV